MYNLLKLKQAADKAGNIAHANSHVFRNEAIVWEFFYWGSGVYWFPSRLLNFTVIFLIKRFG